MKTHRLLALTIGGIALLVLTAAAFACSGNGEEESGTPQGAAEGSSDLDAARSFMQQMMGAAQTGDMGAAHEAFEGAHDHLHEVIGALEASDPDLAAELQEAVDHAEEALEEGEEMEHVMDEAAEIADLLAQVEGG